jgi:catechol 2,3-dioxygenase-like lactoylglutathione lyase family enzyme
MTITVEGAAPLIQVFDMPTSVAFYRDLLGFTIVSQSSPGDDFDWGWLTLGDAELMLNTAYENDSRPSSPDPRRIAAHADTALYFGCRDVDGVYEYLRSRGVACEPPTNAPYGMRQLHLNDPDGYVICFQWPVEITSRQT